MIVSRDVGTDHAVHRALVGGALQPDTVIHAAFAKNRRLKLGRRLEVGAQASESRLIGSEQTGVGGREINQGHGGRAAGLAGALQAELALSARAPAASVPVCRNRRRSIRFFSRTVKGLQLRRRFAIARIRSQQPAELKRGCCMIWSLESPNAIPAL
jgi:hypothetical protein